MRLIKLLGAGTILVSSFITLEALAGWSVIGTCTDPSGDVWKLKYEGSSTDAGKLSKNGDFFKQYDSYTKRTGPTSRSRVKGVDKARADYEHKCSN
tara:strand:+ start:33 stop:320 length:288 start_codon:yes stop_codon:yes gene_type:complete